MSEEKELDYIPGAGIMANIEYLRKKAIERNKALEYQYTDDGYYILNEHNLKLTIKCLREIK